MCPVSHSIGVRLTSDWSRKWQNQSKGKSLLTHTQVKTALLSGAGQG